jgi:hypothetical protein
MIVIDGGIKAGQVDQLHGSDPADLKVRLRLSTTYMLATKYGGGGGGGRNKHNITT